MATTPKVYGPDGVLRETLVFSTTQETRFFTGTMDTDTVDMMVSINGAAFSSESDLIYFYGTTWVVPNPSAYPDGMELLSGDNTLVIQSYSTNGSASNQCSITARLVQESDVGLVSNPPTNITIEQQDTQVEIQVEGLTTTGFQGFNFYASKYAGGGSTGYQQVNLNLVTTYTTTQEVTVVASYEIDAEIKTDSGGNPVADPMFYLVTGQQTDSSGTVVQDDFSERVELSEDVRDVRTNFTVSSVRQIAQFVFDHNRLAGPTSTPPTVSVGEFAAMSDEDYLYYVVTAVFYDPSTTLEFESTYSQEVVGRPLKIRANIGTFPVVSLQQIVGNFTTSVFRSNPQVKVEEGSSLRDLVIDPFASEAERLRFIVDFLHRCSAPALLLAVDDPNNTGTSSDVASTPYKLALKQAFRIGSSADTQALIDSAFDAYASNFGKTRRPGRFAQGEVTFYMTTAPTSTKQFPIGTTVQGGSIQYRTTRAASIQLNNLASSYSPVTGRYSVTVPVKAITSGSTGNVGKGQVRRVVSSISGVSVTNSAAMFGGKNQETNKQLMERVQRALASVDSGTKQGYLQTAADVPGVVQASVVAGGDALMQRDLDSSGVHRGGKVDVWVQGENLATVTDTFAFSFEIAQDIQFEVVGSPSNYVFRAADSNLSTDNPIVEMLDYPDAGYQFKNVTTGLVFDLTGVTITSYNTIQLSTSVVQPSVTLTDVVLGSYRRRIGNEYIPTRQPVAAITQLEGVSSGIIPSTYYALYHPDDPMQKGMSTLASDNVLIESFTATDGSIIPSGDLIAVSDEPHVLVGAYPEYLDNLGAVFLTVEVWDTTGTTQYKGPDDPSGDPDYTILLGTQTTPVAIQRVDTGDIASGQQVLVSYSHDENFTLTYQTNLVVSVTQDAIDAHKHATADVLAKAAVPIPVDISATVILNQGTDQSVADQNLRTNLTNFLENLRLGVPARQSDIINVIERTSGVSYVVVPLTQMVSAAGSMVLRERLTTDLASEVTQVQSLSTDSVLVWLIEETLTSATSNSGGSTTDFRGVFQNDIALTLLSASAQLSALGLGTGRAYVIGSNGAVIQGVSDDATLIALGYLTPTEIINARKEITGNHVLVSTRTGDSPVNYDYTVTYIVSTDTGAHDIDPGDAEYLTTGTFTFTYDEDSA